MKKQVRGFFSEFKAFAIKGNVVDLAVGVVIGAAFGKIVSSLVTDVITPLIGIVAGGVNFKELSITLRGVTLDPGGTITSQPIMLTYGNFLQTVFDFTITAIAIFLMVKVITRLRRKEEEKPTMPPEKSAEEKVLEEIRDILKKK